MVMSVIRSAGHSPLAGLGVPLPGWRVPEPMPMCPASAQRRPRKATLAHALAPMKPTEVDIAQNIANKITPNHTSWTYRVVNCKL